MPLNKQLLSKLSRGNTTNIYASQQGLYGHEYRANADGSSGTDFKFSAIIALEETVVSYRDFTQDTPVSYNSVTLPAGFEIVGWIDSVNVTSGKVICYKAGF